MANRLPLAAVGGAYTDDVRQWSVQDAVNSLVVNAERGGTRTPSILRQVPGFYRYLTLGSGPIRGARDVEGQLFIVSGSGLFKINPDRTYAYLGSIGGASRVSMTHNQVTGGNQIVIVAGSTGYVYDTSTLTLSTITDDAFIGASSVDYTDGYITGVEPGGRFWFHSNLANAFDYSTVDRYESETAPDKIVTHIVSNREVLVFNQRTTDVFSDTGEATNTFQRQNGVSINIGCISKNSPCRVGGTVCFLGSDGIVYIMNGYTPERISTHAIEQAIAECNPANAFSFSWEEQGHRVYYLTFPDGHTWGYDLTTREWHRRESFGLSRWRANTLTRWNGLWIVGDYNSGDLFVMTKLCATEAGNPLVRRRRCSVVSSNQNRVFVPEMEILAQVGSEELLIDNLDNPALAISGNLPDGPVNEVVSYQYALVNGVPPYTVTISSGALPTGLSIDNTGKVTGTRTGIGSFTWTVRAVDQDGTVVTLNDTSITTGIPVLLSPLNDYYLGSRLALSAASVTGWAVAPLAESSPEYREGGFVCFGTGATWYVYSYDTSTGAYSPCTISGTKYGQVASMSHDGTWVVTADDIGASVNLYVYKRTGTILTLTNGPYATTATAVSRLSFSPLNTKIAQMNGGSSMRIHTFDTTTGVVTVGSSISVSAIDLAWHPDGRYIATITNAATPSNGSIAVRDTNSGVYAVVGSTAAAASGNRTGLNWHPDGTVIYASADYNSGNYGVGVYAFTVSGGLTLGTRYTDGGLTSTVRVSHDGQWLVSCNYGASNIYTYQINASDYTLTLSQSLAGVNRCAFWVNYDLV